MAGENKCNSSWIVGFLIVAAVVFGLKQWAPPQLTVEQSAMELSRTIMYQEHAVFEKAPRFPPR
ncbi:MAG: hypothetical protein C0467_29330 [Planctomycetaceae bacterium]|nr:hypothetical protein [Planctomycetaceae bacterium]